MANPQTACPTEADVPRPDRRDSRRWASLQEAATYMGVGRHTVRVWIAEGRITGYRINQRVIRGDLNDLDAALPPFGGGA